MVSHRYEDRTLRNAALLTGAASLASFAGAGLALAGGSGLGVFAWLVVALIFFFITYFYRSAVPVEVLVGPEGITKEQGLGLGWHADWAQVQDLRVLAMTPPRLVVVSDHLPARRGLNEWAVRKADIPERSRTVVVTAELLDAVTDLSGRDLTAPQ